MNQTTCIKMSVAGLSLFFSSLAFSQATSVPSKTEVLQSHSHTEFPVSITANALFLYQSSNFYSEDQSTTNVNSSPNGLGIREVEVQVTAPVDEYSKIDIQLSASPKYEVNGTEGVDSSLKLNQSKCLFYPLLSFQFLKISSTNSTYLYTLQKTFYS